jgi:alkanesulfonate monooxygenase
MTTPADTAPLDFFWFIPTHGDGSYLGSEEQQRPPEFGYFKEIAQAVDRSVFPACCCRTGRTARIPGSPRTASPR